MPPGQEHATKPAIIHPLAPAGEELLGALLRQLVRNCYRQLMPCEGFNEAISATSARNQNQESFQSKPIAPTLSRQNYIIQGFMRIITIILCLGLVAGFFGWQYQQSAANDSALATLTQNDQAVQLEVSGMT